MADPRKPKPTLNRLFLAWLFFANLAAALMPSLLPEPGMLGPTWLWTAFIPACCLVLLNPRRFALALLALFVLPIWAGSRVWRGRLRRLAGGAA